MGYIIRKTRSPEQPEAIRYDEASIDTSKNTDEEDNVAVDMRNKAPVPHGTRWTLDLVSENIRLNLELAKNEHNPS